MVPAYAQKIDVSHNMVYLVVGPTMMHRIFCRRVIKLGLRPAGCYKVFKLALMQWTRGVPDYKKCIDIGHAIIWMTMSAALLRKMFFQ